MIDVQSQTLKVFQNPTPEAYQIEKNYTDGTIFPLAFSSLPIAVHQLMGK